MIHKTKIKNWPVEQEPKEEETNAYNPWEDYSTSAAPTGNLIPRPGETITIVAGPDGQRVVKPEDIVPPPTIAPQKIRLVDGSKEAVNHPDHYKENGFEVIDIINAYEHVRGSFALGNAVKYILRAGKKSKDTYIEDLKKAIWYLNEEVRYQEEKLKQRQSLTDSCKYYVCVDPNTCGQTSCEQASCGQASGNTTLEAVNVTPPDPPKGCWPPKGKKKAK